MSLITTSQRQDSWVVMSANLEPGSQGLNPSCPLPAVWPWASYLTSLDFTYKMNIIIIKGSKWIHMAE